MISFLLSPFLTFTSSASAALLSPAHPQPSTLFATLIPTYKINLDLIFDSMWARENGEEKERVESRERKMSEEGKESESGGCESENGGRD